MASRSRSPPRYIIPPGRPLEEAIFADKRAAFERIAADCMQSLVEYRHMVRAEKPLLSEFLKINPARTEPWQSIMERNSTRPTPGAIPVFIAQGTADTTVHPPITHAYVKQLCADGAHVRFVPLKGVGHTFAAKKSARSAVAWMAARFHGQPAPNDCGGL